MSSNGYHDKIRKILAMLEGAKTEGEAKAANLALQRLLAKSNLTAEQVGALGSEDPSASIEEEPVYIGSNDVVWKRMLASAIAENLRCRVMLTAFPDKPRAKIIVFVGHAEDAAVASECYRLPFLSPSEKQAHSSTNQEGETHPSIPKRFSHRRRNALVWKNPTSRFRLIEPKSSWSHGCVPLEPPSSSACFLMLRPNNPTGL